MKFKEIKPGMVIHCPKEEDARALLEYLDAEGYIWEDTLDHLTNNTRYDEGDTYSLDYIKGEDITFLRVTHDSYDWAIENGYTPTEFSDLIEPDDSPIDSPMSAVEVLEWLHNHYNDYSGEFFTRLFGADYTLSELLIEKKLSPREIVDTITAYEAAKKEKPVEVEEGWRCEIACHDEITSIYNLWGVTQEAAWDSATDRALSYTRETGKEASADVWYVCRVKENKS